MTLKQKTITGLKWSFIDNSVNTGIQFITGIVLARLLNPGEWGLIGMITIFISVSQAFIDSGFSNALIRKESCTDTDYSTVFFFNISIGFILYLVLFFCAGPVSRFYEEPQLFMLIRILGIGLLISSFTIIQRTRLTREINFKLQAQVSIIASLSSGILSIFLAIYGFGVWSLVTKTISQSLITLILLWTLNRWKPLLVFSKTSFLEMFKFGYKLLLSGLIYTLNNNIFYLIIGKFFSANDLGYYSRADQFKNLPSTNITGIIQRVSYPVLSSIQDDQALLKKGYQKLVKSTMFITFVLMTGMAAVAKPMIIVLIGVKWLPAVPYLQLLCFTAMLYPLHALNLNILQVKGRSDLFLRLEVLKAVLMIPVILTGIKFGIYSMILAMIATSLLAYFLNSYYSGSLINYPSREQVIDILPSFFIALFMGIIVFSIGFFLSFKPVLILLIQISTGAAVTHLIASVFKIDAYIEAIAIIRSGLVKYPVNTSYSEKDI